MLKYGARAIRGSTDHSKRPSGGKKVHRLLKVQGFWVIQSDFDDDEQNQRQVALVACRTIHLKGVSLKVSGLGGGGEGWALRRAGSHASLCVCEWKWKNQ